MTNFIGNNYNEAYDIVDIAKLIKKDIKKTFPQINVSVKTSRYSGGQSINIYIQKLPFNPFTREYILNHDRWQSWRMEEEKSNNNKNISNGKLLMYNQQYLVLEDNVDKILQSYNYDKSDIDRDYFRTNFYGSVTLDSDYAKIYLNKK